MPIALSWNKNIIGLLSLLSATSLIGCGSDNLAKTQTLGPLRVLALIASSPEVEPGGTTTIAPVLSDFDKGSEAGRSWTFTWKTCADPGISYGAEPRCQTEIASGGPTSIASLTAANYFTAKTSETVTFTAPNATDSFWTSRSLLEQTNGVPLVFEFTLTAGGERVQAFRRIIVTNRALRNANPSLTDVTVEGASIKGALGALPGSEKKILPILAAGSEEAYSILLPSGVRSEVETLTVSWFTTLGEFKFNRTDGGSENTYTPPEAGTPKGLLILRDDRGGISDPITIGY